MTISSGQPPESSVGPPRPGSPQRKRRISSLFGREENQPQPHSKRPLVAFFFSPKPKDRKKPFLTLQDVAQAFAVYPERPELINKSTLMKIEGKFGKDDAAMNMRNREGWILVMPELEAGVPQANETIRWLIGTVMCLSVRLPAHDWHPAAFHDSFSLYGRPKGYSWDPRDVASMMFAYPTGPSRDVSLCSLITRILSPLSIALTQLLFMEREFAESMDPREDRTSAVRSRLNDILSNRMQGLASGTSQKINAPSSHTPINEPPKGTLTDGSSPLPQLPPLGFGSSDPEAMHRSLTPIVETSSTEKDPIRPVISAPAVNPPQESDGPALPSKEVRSEDQVSASTSPAPVSPPSAYTPTDVASTAVSPRGPSEESAPNASVAKPKLETGIYFAGGVSSERPSNDDGRARLDGRAPSTTSLHSSAASPPPLSPANSSNPPASVSPGLAPPRTPSPKFSVLTSPHSMSDSPTRGVGQSFGDFGSSTERLGRQSWTPPAPLRAATVASSSKLGQQSFQEGTPPSRDGALDIYDEAGALFYIHNLEQGSLELDPRPLPDPNGKDASSESEDVLSRFPQDAQPTVAPLRPRGSTSPPPQHLAYSPSLSLSLDISHRKPPHQQLPRSPTLDYGPERRPFGARAAPASNRQDTLTSTTHSPRTSMRSSIVDTNTQRGNNMTQLEDPDADALAAFTFLERHDNVPPVPTVVTPSPFEPQQQPPTIVEPEARSPSPESDSASVYKSSFAPSKNAMQRKAKSEAQQAAHEAATHRPGRGAGKAKGKSKAGGGWEDSSEEDEEEDDDDDEDVDSDGQPAAPRDDRSVSNYAASANNHRSQYSSPRGPSPLASGDASSYQAQPHTRPPRNLPPVPPPRMQGMSSPS
jgi:CCR4-NOT transcriptional complex subunit CAF120